MTEPGTHWRVVLMHQPTKGLVRVRLGEVCTGLAKTPVGKLRLPVGYGIACRECHERYPCRERRGAISALARRESPSM